jgi:hypothetical protein
MNSKDEAINKAIKKLSEVTHEDFHGYRSEIWLIISEAIETVNCTTLEELSDIKSEVDLLRQDWAVVRGIIDKHPIPMTNGDILVAISQAFLERDEARNDLAAPRRRVEMFKDAELLCDDNGEWLAVKTSTGEQSAIHIGSHFPSQNIFDRTFRQWAKERRSALESAKEEGK